MTSSLEFYAEHFPDLKRNPSLTKISAQPKSKTKNNRTINTKRTSSLEVYAKHFPDLKTKASLKKKSGTKKKKTTNNFAQPKSDTNLRKNNRKSTKRRSLSKTMD